MPPQITNLDLSFARNVEGFDFERLSKLKVLKLAASDLSKLPAGILSLTELQELDLFLCPLESLPKGLGQMPNLRSLSIGGRRQSLPPADLNLITELVGLRVLHLSFLGSDEVSRLTSKLPGLEGLHLYSCELEAIPEAWVSFGNLQELSITFRSGDKQQQREIANIEKLLSLQHLRSLSFDGISCRGLLTALPRLRELRSFHLSHCHLGAFPPQVFQLDHLEDLAMTDANVGPLPSSIERLRNLKSINLSSNNMGDLPEEIGELEQLEALWIYNGGLSRAPKSLRRLRNLKVLSLAGNRLGCWPPEIFELSKLEQLRLGGAGISEIPKSIDRLRKLTELGLDDNQISVIPPEIGELPLLKGLDIKGNPVTSPQPEIVAGGTAAIQDYFSGLLDSKSGRLFEAKLIIVGAGAVGKTCLAEKMVDRDYDIEKHRKDIETTRGIAIKEWHTATPVAGDFKINIWDFGGQEIYHATHQFFLTKRSLYVFVWDARREEHIQGFDYWLNVVKLLSDSSPVLVVLNKADLRIKEIDQKSLKERFQNIVGFYKVSALTGQGMPELVEQVKADISALPHVGDEWPGKWSRVRSALESDSRNYVDVEDYLRICEGEGLTGSQADTLSFYLHNLGVILHFRDDPVLQRIVILKPEWGTNAVYAVLDTKKVQANHGRFSFDDLAEIWGRTTYPRSRHGELLQLMKRFELCFELEDSNEYIAPELLSPTRPNFRWDDTDTLRFEYHYDDFMPAGIITRFIARNHTAIEGDLYWHDGVVLAWDRNRALVVAEPLNRKIRISVSGNDRKGALAVIRRDLERIHKTMNNPSVRQMVPCVCEKCRIGDPFFFEYNRLRGFQENGIDDIPCERSYRKVPIQAMLSGVFNNFELARSSVTESSGGRIHIEKIENYFAGGGDSMGREKEKSRRPPSPWQSGSFYLVSLVLLILLAAGTSKWLGWWALPLVIIGATVGVTTVGALQLRQDQRLSEHSFLKLMALAFRQLPLLKQVLPGNDRAPKMEIKG